MNGMLEKVLNLREEHISNLQVRGGGAGSWGWEGGEAGGGGGWERRVGEAGGVRVSLYDHAQRLGLGGWGRWVRGGAGWG